MAEARDPWCCPRCGLNGDHLKGPDPHRCLSCCRIDAADDLYEALMWAMGQIGRHSRVKGQNDSYCDHCDFATAALAKARGES